MSERELPPPASPPEVDPSVPVPSAGIQPADVPAQPRAGAHARATYLPSRKRRGTALCLSGGGYRAALFHLGAVRRLNELGILGRLDTITSVSGGSILAGHLAASIGPWPEQGETAADFEAKVAAPFHALCSRNIRTGPLTLGLLSYLLPWNWDGHVAVDRLERELFTHLTGIQLRQLPMRPRFVFCASDMAYGVNWTFTRDEVGSYMAGYAQTPEDWTVARAIAASSCFPPFFNPQPVGLRPDLLRAGEDRSAQRDRRIRGLRLSDGGLYDNMGIEPVWKSHAVVLVSEGGSTFDAGQDRGLLWRLNRYVEIIARQGGATRRRWLVASLVEGVLRGTFWGIGTDIANYDVPSDTGCTTSDGSHVPAYPVDVAQELIAEIRTDLDAFSQAERFVLENHGYQLADAAIRRHADFLMSKPMAPARVSHCEWMDPMRVRTALAGSAEVSLFGRF